jgi:hypothetical protein
MVLVVVIVGFFGLFGFLGFYAVASRLECNYRRSQGQAV